MYIAKVNENEGTFVSLWNAVSFVIQVLRIDKDETPKLVETVVKHFHINNTNKYELNENHLSIQFIKIGE